MHTENDEWPLAIVSHVTNKVEHFNTTTSAYSSSQHTSYHSTDMSSPQTKSLSTYTKISDKTLRQNSQHISEYLGKMLVPSSQL